MSGGLAPSKSTVYVSNFPFTLTNNDLHKIFEKYGKVVKVTIVKDKITHRSKGVAFVLFLERESAHRTVAALNNTEMFGRTIKCSIAKDNGRTTEFIRRKEYKDKSHCYECGEEGHLSYACPKNLLGQREPPPKKKKKFRDFEENEEGYDSNEDVVEAPESLASAIKNEQLNMVPDTSIYANVGFSYPESSEPKKKKFKKDAYFSDEEELDDD
ncbi:zinc finger CCHC-type and RNA-binding motif-containing protein 1 [Patella vulgata]|uniref:zinc finger CCHC-type and RNA-binding motif-containing protein 1 n=1 Tax=Patella vulgata TaxID=6465 RepID=UPI00217FBD64|nr:zinc finger CCHC-type and RNA-binding motif-containing protein 1 [Patella vulgata]